jgi:hypothetical protein
MLYSGAPVVKYIAAFTAKQALIITTRALKALPPSPFWFIHPKYRAAQAKEPRESTPASKRNGCSLVPSKKNVSLSTIVNTAEAIVNTMPSIKVLLFLNVFLKTVLHYHAEQILLPILFSCCQLIKFFI